MRREIKLAIMVWVVLMPAMLQAAYVHESLLKSDIGAPVLDLTASPDEDLVLVLTRGEVLIYSTSQQAVLDRIPVEKHFDRIACLKGDLLALTSAEPSRINLIRFSRIYDINVTGRAVKGPPDAKASIVVFDDYQ